MGRGGAHEILEVHMHEMCARYVHCVCVCVHVHNTLRCATDLNSPPPTFNQALGVRRLVFLTSQDESKESQ